MVTEEYFLMVTILILFSQVKKGNFQCILENYAGAAIKICGSAEPEPKEIISAPQHWLPVRRWQGTYRYIDSAVCTYVDT
jgi:hypothetical protein